VYDINPDAARALADRASQRNLPATIASSPSEAAVGADMCVTCTTSTAFLLRGRDVSPGSFVAGVGVDWERKRELAPSLLEQSKIVTDVTAQCAAFGDLHHAIEAGTLTIDSVHAELGAVVAGVKPGRESNAELIVSIHRHGAGMWPRRWSTNGA
jgi:ornithine cyclodeaminase/alanine dehydrogenase-like protein (mu-crystallin family)